MVPVSPVDEKAEDFEVKIRGIRARVTVVAVARTKSFAFASIVGVWPQLPDTG